MKTANKTRRKAPQKPQEASGVRICCSHTDLSPTAALRPNPANPNTHPEAQVDRLARIIQAHGWRHPITVSKRSRLVVSGHCRLLAAQKLGLAEVPVDEQDFASDAEEYAVLIADNVVQELAEVDGLKMAELLCELDQANYDLELPAGPRQAVHDLHQGVSALALRRAEAAHGRGAEGPVLLPGGLQTGRKQGPEGRSSRQCRDAAADEGDSRGHKGQDFTGEKSELIRQ